MGDEETVPPPVPLLPLQSHFHVFPNNQTVGHGHMGNGEGRCMWKGTACSQYTG